MFVWKPFKHLLFNSYQSIQIQAQTGVWDTHGVIFIFKTSPSQTYIQLQAQKGLIRVGPRMQMNELLVLISEAEQEKKRKDVPNRTFGQTRFITSNET